jgi:signal transduction histidine kinase
MLLENDLDLKARYYRLRGRRIYYSRALENYRRYAALAPILAEFSSLSHGFVHDMGNGLNAIRGKLERLSAVATGSEHTRTIAQAKAVCDSCGWRLYILTEVSPSAPTHPEPVNLPEWIPKMLDTLKVWHPPSVQVIFDTTESRLIVADYDNVLRLALLEPLLNAFQVLTGGGRVSVFLQKVDGGLAHIEIVDTGPGLPAGNPEQCLDVRFTTGIHRYGLGLYVARKVVEKHRGTLGLRSEPGQGTRVVIQLPVGNPEPDWDDESALVQELESLHDAIGDQEQELNAYRATYDLPRDQKLIQLSALFGQLSAPTVRFLEIGLANIRRLLSPLSGQMSGQVADYVQFIFEKCDYCDLVLGNAHALDPDWAIKPTPTDLNEVASQAIQLMQWRAQPGTHLCLTRAASLPLVQVDAALIGTALLNLLRNGLDAAGRNGRVDVETSVAGDDAIARVANTGRSIPPDKHACAFDLDYTTRKGRPFGLGLHVARAIVTRHSGCIAVRDTCQSQTELEIALPRL